MVQKLYIIFKSTWIKECKMCHTKEVPILINKKSLFYNLERKGSFSKGKGDGNENAKNPQVWIGKTTILCEQHTLSYTSLLSLHDHGVKYCQATVYGRRKHMMTNFSFSGFLKPQELNSREFTCIFHILSELEYKRQSLKKREFTLMP